MGQIVSSHYLWEGKCIGCVERSILAISPLLPLLRRPLVPGREARAVPGTHDKLSPIPFPTKRKEKIPFPISDWYLLQSDQVIISQNVFITYLVYIVTNV